MQGYPRWAESEKIRHKEDLADVQKREAMVKRTALGRLGGALISL